MVGDSVGLRSCATIDSMVKESGGGFAGEEAGRGGRSLSSDMASGVIDELEEVLMVLNTRLSLTSGFVCIGADVGPGGKDGEAGILLRENPF